jgi:glycosyltransferase involved in cell wall biosynthesis
MDLAEWFKTYNVLKGTDRFLIDEHIKKFKITPKLTLLTPVYNTKDRWLRICLNSVLNQIYQNWELCICDNASNPNTSKILDEYVKKDSRIKVIRLDVNQGGFGGTNAALDIATGDYIGFLDSDDEIVPHALYLIAEKLNTNPDANLIYTDEAIVNSEGGLAAPFFKPDFAPHLLMSEFFMSHLSMYKSDLIKKLRLRESAGSHDYDLALRAVEIIPWNTIYHIPVLAYNYRQHSESVAANTESYCIEGAIKSLREHLDRIGRKATVYHDHPWYRVKFKMEEYPHIDILIASINKNDILYNCIDQLLAKTDYPDYTIYLCVTDPIKKAMIHKYGALIKQEKIKFVYREESEEFNYSILANSMNAACQGPLICILNDDIEPLNYNWLEEMASLALQPETGVVGAKLLYTNLTYQHAGCILGLYNTAAHAFKNLPDNNPGYFGRAKLTGNFSMITGACWVMRKEIYDKVGGYDPMFKVAYGDVDFCIKVLQLGLYNVYTPYATLLHKESFSRGPDSTPEKIKTLVFETELLKSRWNKLLFNDPMYNPNLSISSVNFEIARVEDSRYKKPWQTT